jgi:hypothetical protein
MKKFCVLEQGKYVNHPITLEKKELYNSDICDYLRFNWFTDEDPAADITKKDVGGKLLRFSEGRNLLFEKVSKDYEYFILMDEDLEVKSYPERNRNRELILSRINEFLNEWNPIAAVIQTTNIWGKLEALPEKMAERNKPVCIKKHDACIGILRKSFAERVFPIKHNGSDLTTAYQQWIAFNYYPNKFMAVPKLFSVNAIEEQHHHTDDRCDDWRIKIINGFADSLIDPEPWLSNFTSDGYRKQNDMLNDIEPSNKKIEATDEQFSKIFK